VTLLAFVADRRPRSDRPAPHSSSKAAAAACGGQMMGRTVRRTDRRTLDSFILCRGVSIRLHDRSLGAFYCMFPSAHTSLLPERQLDRFIRFSKVNRHIQYTDMQTTERATSATIGRIYACDACVSYRKAARAFECLRWRCPVLITSEI